MLSLTTRSRTFHVTFSVIVIRRLGTGRIKHGREMKRNYYHRVHQNYQIMESSKNDSNGIFT